MSVAPSPEKNGAEKGFAIVRSSYLLSMVSMVAQSLGLRVFGFLSTLILARILSAADFGSYSVSNTTAMNVGRLTRFGIDAGVHALTAHHDVATDAKEISKILGHALALFLIITLFGAVACFLASGTIASGVFDAPELQFFIQMAAVLFAIQMLAQFFYSAFAGLHLFPYYSRISLSTAIFPPIFTILGAAYLGSTGAITGFVGGQVIVLVALAVRFLRLCKQLEIRLVPTFDVGGFWAILKIGLPVHAGALLIVPADYYADGLIVSTHGIAALGNIRICLTISAIVSLLPSFINGPMISRLILSDKNEPENHYAFLLLNIKLILAFSLVIVAFSAPLWPEIVYILFGDKYNTVAHHGSIALMTAVFIIIINVFSNNLIARRRLGLLFVIHATYAAIFFIASLFLIPTYGLQGYLIAQFAAYLLPVIAFTFVFVFVARDRPLIVGPAVVMALLTGVASLMVVLVSTVGAGIDFHVRILLSAVSVGVILTSQWLILTKEEISMIWRRLSVAANGFKGR